MDKNKINQAYTLAFIPSKHKADQTVIPSLIPSKTNQEGVSKCPHPLFYAQSPVFLKPGLCYFLKFLYL